MIVRCLSLLTALAALNLGMPSLHADPTAADVSFSKQPVFRIPYQTDPSERRLREIQLYVSTDQGRTWQPYANVKPDEGFFTFTSARDGLYWFTVRTVDLEGRGYPQTLEGARAGLKVIVDTQVPALQLRALQPKDGSVGVEWDIRDENLDLGSFVLEQRFAGTPDWSPLRVDPVAAGKYEWRPGTNGNIDVRLKIRDRAGNPAESKVSLSPGSQVTRLPDPPQHQPQPGHANLRLVNSKRISLNYEIKEEGPSGVSTVELWFTQDGRNWQKYGEDPTHRPPYVIDVNDEGVYGFTLVVKSGVGMSDRPPQVGDQPQVWVEVDLTKPNVRLNNVDVGRGSETGNLTITWTASDKNLGRQPINLSYAEHATGPWTPIAMNVENSGRYVWRMPQGIPYKFYVRVEAADKAGNVNGDQTAKMVVVDLAQPKGVITDVAPNSTHP